MRRYQDLYLSLYESWRFKRLPTLIICILTGESCHLKSPGIGRVVAVGMVDETIKKTIIKHNFSFIILDKHINNFLHV